MANKLSVRAVAGMVVFGAFTILITWRAKALEGRLEDRSLTPLLVQKAAPDFSLPTLDGRTISLANYHGKKVVVSFWASWCGPCRLEMPMLREFYRRHHRTANDFELLAISMDEERAPAEAFAVEEKLPFPVLLDLAGTVSRDYGAETIPLIYVIDENGKVIYGHVGFDGALELQLAQQLGIQPAIGTTTGAAADVPPEEGDASGATSH